MGALLGLALARNTSHSTSVTLFLKKWQPMMPEAGGWVTGHEIHADGTFVCRTDTGGAYIWNATTSHWEQLCTKARMPVSEHHADVGGGVYALAIAPSNSSLFWMAWNGWLWKSTDKGLTWVKNTNFVRMETNSAADLYGKYCSRLAIDPVDANVVYLGTTDNGLWYTRNGGTTWVQVSTSSVPVGAHFQDAYPIGVSGVIIDPYAAAVSGRSGTIWASVHADSGTDRGYYQSTDGGDTWSKPADGPPASVVHSCFAADGQIYSTGFDVSVGVGKQVWRWDGTWHNVSSSQTAAHDIACDPNDAARIVITGADGALEQSLDRGATWVGRMFLMTVEQSAQGDIPWFQFAFDPDEIGPNEYMSVGHMSFHPTTADKLIQSSGIGMFSLTLASAAESGTASNWVGQSKGIFQIIPNQAIARQDGTIVLACWDRAIWKLTDPQISPSAYYYPPSSSSKPINHCWAMDYASSDEDTIVALMSGINFQNNYSAYSRDGGDTWTRFAADPDPGSSVYKGAGSVAASTALNWVIQPITTSQADVPPQYTTDGGETWTPCTFSDGTSDFTNGHFIYYLKRKIVAADRVPPNVFYYFHAINGHVYKSTDSGANFVKQTTDAISSADGSKYHTKLKSVPGKAGHLWYTQGPAGNDGDYLTPSGAFKRSKDGGATWSSVDNVLEVFDFAFGVTAAGATYPTIYIIGWVNGNYGIYYSTDECANFTQIADFAGGILDMPTIIEAHKTRLGECYIGHGGSGFAYLQIA